MRRKFVRDIRRAHAAAGVVIIGIPAAAGALTAGRALAQSATDQGTPLPAQLRSASVRFGRDVVASGHAPAANAGDTVQLQYAAASQTAWSALSTSTIRRDGSYRLAAPLRHSGRVRVLDTSSSSTTAQAADASAQRVSVIAELHMRSRVLNVLGGGPAHVLGRLMPGVAGRRVRLEAREAGAWRTVATARTGGRGGFDLMYSAGGAPGSVPLRVRFAGDHLNGGTRAAAGQVIVFRQAGASWYYDGGTTACGFHASYGVANRDLPCGTQVTFSYGGRSVTATVDDRGPYVGGRDWDLNQNTAGALGFGGVGTVWSSL